MSDDEIIRRLVQGAYELGWSNACHDFNAQAADGTHPIGASLRGEVDAVIRALDPNNLLGLSR